MSAQSFPLACGKYKRSSRSRIPWTSSVGTVSENARRLTRWCFLHAQVLRAGRSAAAIGRLLRLIAARLSWNRARERFSASRNCRLFSQLPRPRCASAKAQPPQSPDFLASPSLAGSEDTLAFVPYPAALFPDKPLGATATLSAANMQDIEQLLDYSIQWTRDSKNDPAAFEALADVLDVRGDIGNDPSPTGSALSALRRARALSADPRQRLRTISKEAWLHLKRDEFADARKLADSALAARPQPSQEDAEVLISLAALTGRANRMEQMTDLTGAAIPRSTPGVPGPVKAIASRLFTRAALGVCGSDITATRKELDDAVDHLRRACECAIDFPRYSGEAAQHADSVHAWRICSRDSVTARQDDAHATGLCAWATENSTVYRRQPCASHPQETPPEISRPTLPFSRRGSGRQ